MHVTQFCFSYCTKKKTQELNLSILSRKILSRRHQLEQEEDILGPKPHGENVMLPVVVAPGQERCSVLLWIHLRG